MNKVVRNKIMLNLFIYFQIKWDHDRCGLLANKESLLWDNLNRRQG